MKKIYLDFAATTPVDNRVIKATLPYMNEKFGNPMSVHSFGKDAMDGIDVARDKVASFLNCEPSQIIFTSGSTESNNLSIKGVIRSYEADGPKGKPHIITSQLEHHCILDACKAVSKYGAVDVTYLPVYKDGIVKISDVKKSIKANTILVSLMYVNNEIGTVQPLPEIGKMLEKLNKFRNRKIVFHTDATQAIQFFDCDVEKLCVDLLSFSGHKIYGPKGIGALYIRKGTGIKKIQHGGEQENQLRAGTHNVPGAVGLGEAISIIVKNRTKKESLRIIKLRNYLIGKVLKEIPDSYVNGSLKDRSPSNANFRFDNVEGEGLILSLDMEGIAASTGSACSSGALEPSHVLLALGLKHEEAHGSLRITIGRNTTKKELDKTVKVLKKVVKRLRDISGKVLEEFS